MNMIILPSPQALSEPAFNGEWYGKTELHLPFLKEFHYLESVTS
jgi:hypothetical protein